MANNNKLRMWNHLLLMPLVVCGCGGDGAEEVDDFGVPPVQLVADPNTIESLEIIKIRPKTCINLQTGGKAKCRGRLKPEDKMQREFIITDEKEGVVKISRRERGKGKPQFEQPEPRLVRVRTLD